MTTSFSNKVEILAEFFLLYNQDEHEKDFITQNDIGLPLAWLISQDLCQVSAEGKQYIVETWETFLSTLGISKDEGFDSLEELMVKASVESWPEALNTKDLTLIGHFSVDSGQAMVGDPCYLDEWEPWNDKADKFEEHVNKAGEYSYLGACGVTLKEGYGQLGNGSAVAFSTGYGDGYYPVYAEIDDDGRIAKVVIDFIGHDE